MSPPLFVPAVVRSALTYSTSTLARSSCVCHSTYFPSPHRLRHTDDNTRRSSHSLPSENQSARLTLVSSDPAPKSQPVTQDQLFVASSFPFQSTGCLTMLANGLTILTAFLPLLTAVNASHVGTQNHRRHHALANRDQPAPRGVAQVAPRANAGHAEAKRTIKRAVKKRGAKQQCRARGSSPPAPSSAAVSSSAPSSAAVAPASSAAAPSSASAAESPAIPNQGAWADHVGGLI